MSTFTTTVPVVTDPWIRGRWIKAAGVSFDDRPSAILSLGESERTRRLELIAEPDNPVDPCAMGIWVAPRVAHLGWIPKDIAAEMDPLAEWVIGEYRVRIHPDIPTKPGLDVRVLRIDWAPEPETWVRAGRDPAVGRTHRVALQPACLRERAMDVTPEVVWVGGLQYAVASSSTPGTWRAVVADVAEDGVAEFLCGCPSGFYRPDHLIPCIHAAALGVYLERRGKLVWDERCGAWRVRGGERSVGRAS